MHHARHPVGAPPPGLARVVSAYAPRVERMEGYRADRGKMPFYRGACGCGWRGLWVAKSPTVAGHLADHYQNVHAKEGDDRA